MTEHEHTETGTGWPGETAEPTDAGWPQPASAPPDVVDAVPAEVTETPDESETDLNERAAESAPPAGPGASPAGSAPRAPEGAEPPADGAQRAGESVEQTIDLSRARPGATPPGGTGPRRPRLTSAGALIGALTALLGFGLAVQLRSHTTDPTLASARQEDLVRILSDLQAREERTRQEIADLEERQRQLTSGAQGRQAALQEATQRADELGILAGTLPAQGPGLTVRFEAGREPVHAEWVLDAIQELRGAGAEAMQIAGGNRTAVRVVASTYVVDADGGIEVDGQRLTGPYTITVIGDGQTMRTALNIAGGVVESVQQDGGNVTVHDPGTVQVTALHTSTPPRYARPAK